MSPNRCLLDIQLALIVMVVIVPHNLNEFRISERGDMIIIGPRTHCNSSNRSKRSRVTRSMIRVVSGCQNVYGECQWNVRKQRLSLPFFYL